MPAALQPGALREGLMCMHLPLCPQAFPKAPILRVQLSPQLDQALQMLLCFGTQGKRKGRVAPALSEVLVGSARLPSQHSAD